MTWSNLTNGALLPPFGDEKAPGTHKSIRLSGTGTTESHNSRKLSHNKTHLLVVGSQPIRVSFRGASGLVGAVSTTDMRLPAGAVYPFTSIQDKEGNYGSCFVYVEQDGVAAYEAWIVQSAP